MRNVVDMRVNRVAEEIAQYLAAHPHAADTLDGIATWWLARQRFDNARDLVRAALEMLIERGMVERFPLSSGADLFRSSRCRGPP